MRVARLRIFDRLLRRGESIGRASAAEVLASAAKSIAGLLP
jgi:hypothetical protein